MYNVCVLVYVCGVREYSLDDPRFCIHGNREQQKNGVNAREQRQQQAIERVSSSPLPSSFFSAYYKTKY